MVAMDEKTNKPHLLHDNEGASDLQGYPNYPESEDIYTKYHQEKDINPEDISETKVANEDDKTGSKNRNGLNPEVPGSDLDVPGSEMDDNQEINGSEDEENNYYSLGGDGHNYMEEDKGI
jgi:hypothetical protein